MGGHLNTCQVKNSARTAGKVRLGVFPGDLMSDVNENETEHTLEQGVTEAIPICQPNWKSVKYSINICD